MNGIGVDNSFEGSNSIGYFMNESEVSLDIYRIRYSNFIHGAHGELEIQKSLWFCVMEMVRLPLGSCS